MNVLAIFPFCTMLVVASSCDSTNDYVFYDENATTESSNDSTSIDTDMLSDPIPPVNDNTSFVNNTTGSYLLQQELTSDKSNSDNKTSHQKTTNAEPVNTTPLSDPLQNTTNPPTLVATTSDDTTSYDFTSFDTTSFDTTSFDTTAGAPQ